MGLDSFRARVTVRALLIVALSLALAWGWQNTTWSATLVVLASLIVLCVVDLIRYVEQTSSDLTRFLRFVGSHDFSTPPAMKRKGRVFRDLQDAYKVLAEVFRNLNRQKAANHQYLEAVVEHVGVALVCFDGSGTVTMMNEPARQLFGVPHLNSLLTFGRIDPRLPDLLQGMGDGERALFSVKHGDDSLQLVLYATRFELLEQRYQLVSFQNIRKELDQREIDSWQKLIRVLTHEIMNSVTPITSLSRLIRDTMIDETGPTPTFRTLTPQEQSDMLRSVTAIHTRSRGLLDFVEAYRSFAKLPTPAFADFGVLSLLERVRTLMARELEDRRIALSLDCEDASLVIRADTGQAEQVLINLLRNAVEALVDTPDAHITLRASRDEQGKVLVQVADNGPGIQADNLEDIFVPFFTTKRNGTGVGLSVSRQIMQANNGMISVRSTPGEGSVFTLKFQ
jgi:two-component system, NtrC family, nitrogen regulation sensor histidine kinase NtrY